MFFMLVFSVMVLFQAYFQGMIFSRFSFVSLVMTKGRRRIPTGKCRSDMIREVPTTKATATEEDRYFICWV